MEVLMSKNYTIYSTKYGLQQVETIGDTWGDLQETLKETYNYDLSNLEAVDGSTKHSLVSREAVLPAAGTVIFLRPVKMEFGAMSYKDLRALLTTQEIKDSVTKYAGKNWTNLSSSKLEETLTAIGVINVIGKNIKNVNTEHVKPVSEPDLNVAKNAENKVCKNDEKTVFFSDPTSFLEKFYSFCKDYFSNAVTTENEVDVKTTTVTEQPVVDIKIPAISKTEADNFYSKIVKSFK